jgi:hypothetical protein
MSFLPQLDVFMNPPAIVVEDEAAKYERLLAQGREAAALEQEGKNANVEWVQALKKAYPDVPHFNGRLVASPKAYEIVMEARQCTRSAAKNFIRRYKNENARVACVGGGNAYRSRAMQIRRAAVELATKYRLGADPKACMDALAALIEETR